MIGLHPFLRSNGRAATERESLIGLRTLVTGLVLLEFEGANHNADGSNPASCHSNCNLSPRSLEGADQPDSIG